MGIKRIVDTSFWTDGKVDEFSPEDKYFMLYLLTNPFTTQLGIYEISIKQVAFQLGYSIDAVNVLLDRFENKYEMIIYSKDTNEVAIKNYLRHSIVKGGKPVEDCLEREISKVKNRSLIDYVFGNIFQQKDINDTVRKVVTKYMNEIDNENDNENDNDNDVSLSVRTTNRQKISYEDIKEEILITKDQGDKVCEWCGSKTTMLHKHHYPVPKRMGGKEVVNICSNCHSEFHSRERELLGGSFISLDDEPPISVPKPKKTKPVKHKYGEYKNVLLTDDELQKLKTEYSDYEDRIERLSSYVASTGKSYKSHYATIRNWARKDKEQGSTRQVQGRKEIVPEWMQKKNKFNNFEQRNYNMTDLEGQLLGASEPKSEELSPEYKKRVEDLKKSLGVM